MGLGIYLPLDSGAGACLARGDLSDSIGRLTGDQQYLYTSFISLLLHTTCPMSADDVAVTDVDSTEQTVRVAETLAQDKGTGADFNNLNEQPTTTAPVARQWPNGVQVRRYVGGCHCRKFVFEFDHPDIYQSEVVTCNCSICTIRGGLYVYVPIIAHRLLAGLPHCDLLTFLSILQVYPIRPPRVHRGLTGDHDFVPVPQEDRDALLLSYMREQSPRESEGSGGSEHPGGRWRGLGQAEIEVV